MKFDLNSSSANFSFYSIYFNFLDFLSFFYGLYLINSNFEVRFLTIETIE